MMSLSKWTAILEKLWSTSHNQTSLQSNSLSTCVSIGLSRKSLSTQGALVVLSRTSLRAITEPSSPMGRLVPVRLIPWLDRRTTQYKKESCQGPSKTCSRGLRETQSRRNSLSGPVISRSITRRLEIFSLKIQRTDLTFMRSQTQVSTFATFPTLQWRVYRRSTMSWRLEWKIDLWDPQTWMLFLQDLILSFRSLLRGQRLEPMASSILELVSLTWSIWRVRRESPRQEQLEID